MHLHAGVKALRLYWFNVWPSARVCPPAVIGVILGILYLNMDKSNKVCTLISHSQITWMPTRSTLAMGPRVLYGTLHATLTEQRLCVLQGIQDRNGLIFFILIGTAFGTLYCWDLSSDRVGTECAAISITHTNTAVRRSL